MLAGVVLNSLHNGQEGLINSIYGLITGLSIFLIPFLFGGIGAGDVKLMGAIGSLTGPAFALGTGILGSIIGGFMAVGVLIKRKILAASLKKMFHSLTGRGHLPDMFKESEYNPKIPYGVAISLGAIILTAIRNPFF